MGRERDRGYALVAAVTAVAAFAYIAFQVLASDRGLTVGVAARAEQARLAAAADAGISLAIHALAQKDRVRRWSIDGRSRSLDFGGVNLVVTVEDERGKAPLDALDDSQARALFEGAGATGERVDALVDELREWRALVDEAPDDPTPTANFGVLGAPAGPGHFRTVGALMALPDMDPELFSRIAPAVTVFFEESGPFAVKNAQPLAIAALAGSSGETPETIEREREQQDERPDEEIAADEDLTGRTLTIRVVAQDRNGARAHRAAIIELTGAKDHPYWVRYVE